MTEKTPPGFPDEVRDALAGTRLLGRGTFRIDRRRARDKLAHFQLAHPEHFVLELLAAGIRADAREIRVRHDADDIVVSWSLADENADATPASEDPARPAPLRPDAGDLHRLFEWLFSRSPAPYPRMMQHIAQGVFGALGTDPARVWVELPECVLDLGDPDHPVVRTRPSGQVTSEITIHVRRRFGFRVARDALLMTLAAAARREAEVIRELACWSPVPIIVNGAALDRSRLDPPSRVTHHASPREALWIEPEKDLRRRGGESEAAANDPRSVIAVIRDGVRVETLQVQVGALRLRGWIRHDVLELDASRARVVDDGRRRAAVARLYVRFASLIHTRLSKISPYHRLAKPLRAALVEIVHDHPEFSASIRHVPTLHDAARRAWSLAQLDRSPRILRLRDDSLAHADVGEPQFVAKATLPEWIRDNPRSPEVLQWGVLERAYGDRVIDADEELRRRAVGRAQREYQRTVLAALRGRVPGTLDAHEFSIRETQLRADAAHAGVTHGVIHLLDTAHLPGDRMRVELRVDGLPCETVTLPHPGPLFARVAAPGLTANDAFDHVARDERFDEVIEAVRVEAEEFVRALSRGLPALGGSVQRRDLRVREFLCRWCQQFALTPNERGDPLVLRARIPADILSAPLFPAIARRPGVFSTARDLRSLDPMLLEVAAKGRLRFVRDTLGSDLVPDGTLSLSKLEIAALHNLLGSALEDMSEAVLADRIAARRRASAGATPMIAAPARHHLKIDGSELRGELAIADEPAVGDCRALIIHEGVELGHHEIPLGVPGVIAAISWSAAQPNRAWTDLRDRPQQLAVIAALLADPVASLVERASAGRSWTARDALPPWFAGGVARTGRMPERLARQAMFRGISGQTYAAEELFEGARRHGSLAFISDDAVLIDHESKIEKAEPTQSHNGDDSNNWSNLEDGFSAAGLRIVLRAHVHGRRPVASVEAADDILVLDPVRQVLVAALIAGATLRSCDGELAQLLTAWDRFANRPRAAATLASRFVSPQEFHTPTLRGSLALSTRIRAEALELQCWFAGRPLCTISAPYPVPLTGVVQGPAVLPDLTLQGCAGPWVEAELVEAARGAIPGALENAVSTSPRVGDAGALSLGVLNRHLSIARQRLLRAALRRALELSPTMAGAIADSLRRVPIFATANHSRLLSTAELEALARDGEFILVPADSELDPSKVPDDLLQGHLVYAVPAIAALQTTGVLPPVTPRADLMRPRSAPPAQDGPADTPRPVAEVRCTVETADLWIGLIADGSRSTRNALHEWYVDNTLLVRERGDAPSPVVTRSHDLDLTGKLQPDRAIRQRTLSALPRCLEALAQELAASVSHRGASTQAALWTVRGLRCSVTIHDWQAALTHITRWCAAQRLAASIQALPLFPCHAGEPVSFAALLERAEREPLSACAPDVEGLLASTESRPLLLASAELQATLASALGPVLDAREANRLAADQPDALLLERAAPEGLRGWLQLRSSGLENLWVASHDGTSEPWRSPLPVPLAGAIAPLPGHSLPDADTLTAALVEAGQRMLREQIDTADDQDAPGLWLEVTARTFVDPINDHDHGVERARGLLREASGDLARVMRMRWIPTTEGRQISLADCLRDNKQIPRVRPADAKIAGVLLDQPAVILADRPAGRLHPLVRWVPGIEQLSPTGEISSPERSPEILARTQLELDTHRVNGGSPAGAPRSSLVTVALTTALDQPGRLELDTGSARSSLPLDRFPGVVVRVEPSLPGQPADHELLAAPELRALERAIASALLDNAVLLRTRATSAIARLFRAARSGAGLSRASWLPLWLDVPLWREPAGLPAEAEAARASATLRDVLESRANFSCVLVGDHAPAAGGPLTICASSGVDDARGEADRELLVAAIGRDAIKPVIRWRPRGETAATRARANRGVLRDRILQLLEQLDEPVKPARATVNEALDRLSRGDDSGYEAALARPHGRAGLVFAWTVADQLLAESGAPARCLELVDRVLL